MVSHHPEQTSAEAFGERLDERAKGVVGGRLAEIGEVTGEDEGVRPHAGRVDALDRATKIGLGIDAVVQPSARVSQVRVADVQQDAVGSRVLCLAGGHAEMLPACFGNTG